MHKIEINQKRLARIEKFLILGTDKLKQIYDVIIGMDYIPLRIQDVKIALEKGIPDFSNDFSVAIEELFALCSLKRRLNLEPRDLFQILHRSIADTNGFQSWSDDKLLEFEKLEKELIELISLPALSTAVKATSLKYDYSNLSQSIKILTDIRPVYNEDGREIVGALVSFILRLYYQSLDGLESLSVALDEADIRMLLKTCDRALTKADTAKRLMKDKANIETWIHGEEDS